jgi:molybdate transport system ATP-binding protein
MTLHVDIKAQLGAFALDVQFTAPSGVTVLFGPSGCGKSSVINAIAGLIRPDQGQIICAARPLFDSAARVHLPPHRRRMGVIFQDARLFPHLNVQQNLTYGRWFAGTHRRGPSLEDVCDLLGIGHLLHRRPAALSGGEAARVAIGRALLSAPDIILADEPLAALDQARRAEILPYFAALRDAALVPMIYVSHSVAEVAGLATTVVAMGGGRVIGVGSVDDIFGRSDVMGADASTMLSARIICHHPDGLTELATEAGHVFVPQINAAIGTSHMLRINAGDVTLARSQPNGLSALNILRGKICRVEAQRGGTVMVTLQAGTAMIRARITQRSCASLGLDTGQTCFAIVKSLSLAKGAG